MLFKINYAPWSEVVAYSYEGLHVLVLCCVFNDEILCGHHVEVRRFLMFRRNMLL
jgi:hypothetical protein